MKTIRIGNKIVGDGQSVFIIAEIGINHNGDIKIAKELIDMAVDAGCDAVKFQKRTPELCVSPDQQKVMRETPWGLISYLEYKKFIELGPKEYSDIDNYCRNKGIMWFASCWDIPSVDFIRRFDPPCYKIASASLTNNKLLEYISSLNKPVILSTGMSTMEEIITAINIIKHNQFIIMHCTSTYPSDLKELNLRVIEHYRSKFDCPVGYSGHESGISPTIISVILGASVVERHITIHRHYWGTDHASSLEPQGLNKLVRDIRNIPLIMGDGVKIVYDSEKPIIKKLRWNSK